jgi:hypothetical protein
MDVQVDNNIRYQFKKILLTIHTYFFMLLFLVLDNRQGFDALPVSRIKAF